MQKKSKYIYQAFGLIISSEIEINDFPITEGSIDVRIITGKVPEKIENMLIDTTEYQISPGEFLFCKEEADFYIKNGDTIIVDIHDYSSKVIINAYLTGAAMGALLMQRGIIPIHGSSVVVEGKGVLFMGASGAGKSTLCSAFRVKNYKFMSDDLTAVCINDEGIPKILPSFPRQKLNKLSAMMMGYKTKGLTKIDEKYIINNEDDYNNEPVPLSAIYELDTGDYEKVGINNIIGSDKLRRLIKNIYYSNILMEVYSNSAYFTNITKAIKSTPYYCLTRPSKKYAVKKLMNMVIDSLNEV